MRSQVVFVALLATLGLADGRKIAASSAVFRSFDGPQVTWQLTDGRPGAGVLAHGCVASDARQGTGSERVIITAPAGESLHFACPIGRLPVLDELESRLWVKANRPGVRLSARVVLPRSTDDKTGSARTLLVPGDVCTASDRWQQLRLTGVPSLLAGQMRVLRASTGRPIDSREAYIDAVVLVVPGGSGRTAVWTDALEVDGVILAVVGESADATRVVPAVAPDQAQLRSHAVRLAMQTQSAVSPPVQIQGATLTVAGRPFFPRGIEWNSEPFAFLAERGFNTVWLNEPPTPEVSAEAARAKVWLICQPANPDDLAASELGDSLERVLAWYLGSPTGPHELDYYRRWAELVRERDPVTTRPVIVAPRGDWLPASRLADVLLANHPASGRLPPEDFSEWLLGMPLLARPGTPMWASVPTQPGKRVRQQLVALQRRTPTIATVLDEGQIESLVTAVATSGYHGILFESAEPLDAGDEATKRRALTLEMLNARLDMIDPWLTVGKRVDEARSTDLQVEGVLLQAERARLLLPRFAGAGATDAARARTEQVVYVVPGIPESNAAFALSPTSLLALPSKRVAGGVRIVVDRNADSLVLMTEDPAVIAGFRQRAAREGRRAAQLQYNLAVSHVRVLTDIERHLKQLGVSTYRFDEAIGKANLEISRVNTLLTANNYEAAYQHSTQARRILLESTTRQRRASNANSRFSSLPFNNVQGAIVEQAEFERSMESTRAVDNLLVGGNFEDLGQIRHFGWEHVRDPMAGVESRVALSGSAPREGRYCLELAAMSVRSGGPPKVIARPLVWIKSPPISVRKGDLLEISGWVRVPQLILGSIEGLEISDSLGGSELALRVRNTNDWQSFRMIRGTSETTDFCLVIALHGLGTAYVDGVTIRSLAPPSAQRLPSVTNEARPAIPNASAHRTLFESPQQR